MLKASHTFNLLDARRAISVTERQRYILRVRTLAARVAQAYLASREALGFPMLKAPAAPAGSAPPGERMSTARHDFLVEIGTEELPPKALRALAEAFVAGVRTGLGKRGPGARRGQRFCDAAAPRGAGEAPGRAAAATRTSSAAGRR